ncbi:uncharacterized protein LTR77_004187 [Saxophila tyrrhenica]|uniref:Uncharacterized protein n=1 Tax=Saxophila tyrrhenica TaxID=1690608 RepID=A0AAV9PG93_9PEZI|nr:hypothetical protein LTR77_004187 [Saxophila tyrrhenica]
MVSVRSSPYSSSTTGPSKRAVESPAARIKRSRPERIPSDRRRTKRARSAASDLLSVLDSHPSTVTSEPESDDDSSTGLRSQLPFANHAGKRSTGPGKVLNAIQIGIDPGTTTLALAHRDVTTVAGKEVLGPIHDLYFGSESFTTQAVAFAADGEFYWGPHVQAALNNGIIQQKDVVELWKLALYDGHTPQSKAKESVIVDKQLGNDYNLDDLLAAYLRSVIGYATEKIAVAKTYSSMSKDEIGRVPVHLFIGVPQMWDSVVNKMLTDAARAAGCASVDTVHESRCATAFYTHGLRSLASASFQIGDIVLVADIGGGTGDFVTFRLGDDPEDGAQVKLFQVGTPDGKSTLRSRSFVNQPS